MKKSAKIISAICTATLLTAMFSGCATKAPSSTGNSQASAPAPSTSNTDTTAVKADLRFSWWGGDSRHEATMLAIDEFNKTFPDVKVSVEYQGYDGYHDKMFTQLAGATAPDLFQYNPENMPEIVAEGKLLSLNEYVDSGILNLDDVSESSLVDTTIDGKIYGIPMSTQTICVIYNKTLFEQANVELPKDDWTWEDYDKIVKELSEKLPKGIYPSTDLRASDITSLAMIHQKNGAYVTPDGKLNFAQAIKWPLETFQKYMSDGIVPPVAESVASTNDTIFMEGRAAIHATFNAMATSLQAGSVNKDEYVLTSIPSANTGDKLGMFVKGEVAFCISADSKNKEAAVILLNEFINNPDMGKILGLCRGIPPSEAIRTMLTADMVGIDEDVFAVQAMADTSKDIPEPRLMKGWMEVLAAINQEVDEYRYGRKDIDTAIKDMQTRAEKEFANAQ